MKILKSNMVIIILVFVLSVVKTFATREIADVNYCPENNDPKYYNMECVESDGKDPVTGKDIKVKSCKETDKKDMRCIKAN